MKYLLTTKPVVDVIRRMRLDILKINDPDFLNDILSANDHMSTNWSIMHANELLNKPNNLLLDITNNLENITRACLISNEGGFETAGDPSDYFKTLAPTAIRGSKKPSNLNYPIIVDVMLLGGNTLVFVLGVSKPDGPFYHLDTCNRFNDCMCPNVRQELLKLYAEMFGVNNMLALSLTSAHLLS